jgi:hypothetical protein
MPVEAVLITGPKIDFARFLTLAYQALGRNLAAVADAGHRRMVDAEKFLSCLAASKDESAEITTNLLAHVSFGVLVIADKRSLLDILDGASGMSFVLAQTVPNVEMAVISGTLEQWRDAVVSGTNEAALSVVRTCYSKILLLFDRAGLTSVWNNFDRRSDHSGFVLEPRRGRG